MCICISVCDSTTPRLKARLYLSSPTEVCVSLRLCVCACVCVLFFCQRNGRVVELSKAVKALEVRSQVRLSACVSQSSWSCGLCIIGSEGHRNTPLPPASCPTISTPFPQTCKCTRTQRRLWACDQQFFRHSILWQLANLQLFSPCIALLLLIFFSHLSSNQTTPK